MLLFKDYFSFKKENKLLLKLIRDTETYNEEINPIIYVLDVLSEVKESDDDELDYKNMLDIFETGFNYLQVYLNYINLFIMENDITIATEMADYISFYIEVSTYLSYLNNEYQDKKLKGLADFDDFITILEEIINDRTKADLDALRKTFVRLLDDIESENNIEIPSEQLYIPAGFEILYDEITNEAVYDFLYKES